MSSSRVSDSFLAGCVSGCVSRSVIEPLDVLKIRFQLQYEPVRKASLSSKYRGSLQALQLISKEEGYRALWKGMLVGQMLYALYNSVQFSVYEIIKGNISLGHPHGAHLVGFVSGSAAGGVATAVCHPLDLMRTRFIGQGEPKTYPNIYKAVISIHAEQGLRSFYKGLTPAMICIIPQTGFYFGFHSFFSYVWSDVLFSKEFHCKWRTFISGAMAGIASKTLMLPFDMTKKRLEVQGFEKARMEFGTVRRYNSFGHCFKSILKEEGFGAFYKGAYVSLLKAGISVAVTFLVYEQTLAFLSDRKH